MENHPFYCPNCRSNRTKFSLITNINHVQDVIKNAVTGVIESEQEPYEKVSDEQLIRCHVCDFVGDELRFIKQAERSPRVENMVPSAY